MKKLWAVLMLLVGLWSFPALADIGICAFGGFECGCLMELSGNNKQPNVVSTVGDVGYECYALKLAEAPVAPEAGWSEILWCGSADYYWLTFYVYFTETDPAPTVDFSKVYLDSHLQFGLRIKDEKVYVLDADGSEVGNSGATTLSDATWYRLGIAWNRDNTGDVHVFYASGSSDNLTSLVEVNDEDFLAGRSGDFKMKWTGQLGVATTPTTVYIGKYAFWGSDAATFAAVDNDDIGHYEVLGPYTTYCTDSDPTNCGVGEGDALDYGDWQDLSDIDWNDADEAGWDDCYDTAINASLACDGDYYAGPRGDSNCDEVVAISWHWLMGVGAMTVGGGYYDYSTSVMQTEDWLTLYGTAEDNVAFDADYGATTVVCDDYLAFYLQCTNGSIMPPDNVCKLDDWAGYILNDPN